MFRSIFSKLIFIFVSILVMGMLITGVALYYFLGDFVSTEKVRILETSGDEINSFLNEYIEYMDNKLVLSAFTRLLRSYGVSTNSLIWVVDKNGYIVANQYDTTGQGIPDTIKSKLKDDAGRLKLPDERQYKRVMQGEALVVERGFFYGLFDGTRVPWLTIEKPFVYNGSVEAGVFLNTPIPEIQRVRTSVIRFFLFSVAISVVISAILVYIFSLRLTRPLKQINEAARVIAGGEFRNRLNINSSDEIGELAKSFNQMVVALQNLEEMRRGFIANVSHELRTPMTSIRGFIEGILDGTIPPEKQGYYLEIVRDETNRLNRLVNDLLDLAHMEAGEVTLNPSEFDINELVRLCIIKLESIIIKKNIQVQADFEEEEVKVRADHDSIERVLYNLIHNAIKFTPENGKITVSTATAGRRDRIQVSVKDNGVGIESDELNLIWDRFYKSDKSRSMDKTGTGLGLAIVKNIINEHNQEIWVESEPGKGTCFTFTLEKARSVD